MIFGTLPLKCCSLYIFNEDIAISYLVKTF